MIRPASEPDCTSFLFFTRSDADASLCIFSRTGHLALSTFNELLLEKKDFGQDLSNRHLMFLVFCL